MGEHGEAFAKGGCGCLLLFAVFAAAAVVLGGSAHIDPLGAACLFVIGGIIGLVVLAIYNKGKQDAQSPPTDETGRDDPIDDAFSDWE